MKMVGITFILIMFLFLAVFITDSVLDVQEVSRTGIAETEDMVALAGISGPQPKPCSGYPNPFNLANYNTRIEGNVEVILFAQNMDIARTGRSNINTQIEEMSEINIQYAMAPEEKVPAFHRKTYI